VLAPAFDVNPNPHRSDHVLTLDGRVGIPDPTVVLDTHDLYRIPRARANAILDDVRRAVATWQQVARRAGLSTDEISRMQRVFGAL
jgi:serine/threonine-protein kinase HipA